MSGVTVAVVGATGLVGSEMISVLNERKFPAAETRLLASADSAGEVYRVGDDEVVVQPISEEAFRGVDLALFATSNELSKQWVPVAIAAGARCIDNSSAHRLQDEVPLVVPEVNGSLITPAHRLIANPNCTTAALVTVLAPLSRAAGLKRVVVSTYQAVSGAGKNALDELWSQYLAVFQQREVVEEHLGAQLAFNLIPRIDTIREDGYSGEEHKVIAESRKILGLPTLAITATAVRVPVLHAHSESVNVELAREFSREQVLQLLGDSPGVQLWPDHNEYPMPLQAVGSDPVHVGRVRRDSSVPCGYDLWIVADNLRKGAALNAVPIAELLIAH